MSGVCAFAVSFGRCRASANTLYRLSAARDGAWRVEWCPWLRVVPWTWSEALAAERAAIAEWLDVPPDAFDVEA